MPKKPAVKKMSLKKQPKPKKVTIHAFRVRFGTRNELGPERQYATEKAAKEAIITEFNSWKSWCERYSRDGIPVIEEAASHVGSIIFHREPARLECCFDDHTGMHITAEYWTTR